MPKTGHESCNARFTQIHSITPCRISTEVHNATLHTGNYEVRQDQPASYVILRLQIGDLQNPQQQHNLFAIRKKIYPTFKVFVSIVNGGFSDTYQEKNVTQL